MPTLDWYKAQWSAISAAMRQLDGNVADNIEAAIAACDHSRVHALWIFIPPWI